MKEIDKVGGLSETMWMKKVDGQIVVQEVEETGKYMMREATCDTIPSLLVECMLDDRLQGARE